MAADTAIDVQSCWKEAYQKTQEAMKVGFQSYFANQPNIKEAFFLRDRSVRCIDEGTVGGIHLAGSGILLDLEAAAKYLKAAQADSVYSHEECGAAKLYASKEKLDSEFCDEYAREWAKTLANYLKVPYKGHIPISQMARPSGLHIATVAYYDATGKFDFSPIQELPEGFVISRKYLEAGYAQEELNTAISIALGHHGFGRRFSAKTPFAVVILSDSNDNLSRDQLEGEVKAAISSFQDRVVLTAIDAKHFLN